MKADPSAQVRLLDLQDLDSRADQLRHQRRSLAEHAVLAELSGLRATLEGQVQDARIAVDDLTTEQTKVDADVEQVKARRQRDQQRIDQGLVSNPKDIQRMQQEMVSLERRISSLEDDEIEVMERLEEAQTAVDRYTSDMAELATEIGTVEVAFEKTSGDLQTQLAAVKDERATAASGMPEDLMALYEKLREQKGGVGAAALRRRECGGCRLTLNASDLSLIAKRPSDDVVRCEECNRILVRTGESGL